MLAAPRHPARGRRPRADPRRGQHAGLVVLTTGLGKDWLRAFDCNRTEFRRILFVAHRAQIPRQSPPQGSRQRNARHASKGVDSVTSTTKMSL